jgi:hypothetical protein
MCASSYLGDPDHTQSDWLDGPAVAQLGTLVPKEA